MPDGSNGGHLDHDNHEWMINHHLSTEYFKEDG